MVIGNGLLASAFNNYRFDDRYVIFASGVSNSSETDDSQFMMEEKLLRSTLKENKEKHFIYFTSFIYFKKYGIHKMLMEDIIQMSGVSYTILKLSQVIGRGGNPANLFNYLVNNIKNGQVINVYNDTYRSLIDVEDVRRIVDFVRNKYVYVSFPYVEKLLIKDIVLLISKALNKNPMINFVDSQGFYYPDRTLLVDYILEELNITPEGYTERIINKYIG